MSVSVFDLDLFLEEQRERVERALQRALARVETLVRPELFGPLRHAVLTGGKRLRPILCATAYAAVAGEERERNGREGGRDAVHDLGAALELIHAYSLMHDDLPCMDDADLRRGRPTPHTLFGEPDTARAGLVLIPAASLHAWECALRLGCTEEVARTIVGDLNRAAGAGGMVGGQALDLLGEGRRLSAAELDGLHRRKTGALLTASLTVGGRAAGAPARVLAALERYGRAVGLAFQVADDILDATATAEELGKNPSDEALDKSTYVTLYGLEEARRRARALVDDARSALAGAGLASEPLDRLAAYVVDRRK